METFILVNKLYIFEFSDLETKIRLFFVKHLGVKAEDFNDFCLRAELMKEKKHLTPVI